MTWNPNWQPQCQYWFMVKGRKQRCTGLAEFRRTDIRVHPNRCLQHAERDVLVQGGGVVLEKLRVRRIRKQPTPPVPL
jgi:hypothetical protein